MLLKHLYDFAVSRHLLDDLAFSPKAVRWIIELDSTGNLLGSGPQATGDEARIETPRLRSLSRSLLVAPLSRAGRGLKPSCAPTTRRRIDS